MHPVSHTTERLALRELTVDDVDAVHAIYGSPRATQHLSFEPRTRDQVGHIVARSMVSAIAIPRQEYCLAVCRLTGGQLIGYARLALDAQGQQAATIGFALHPEVWGDGYGTELVRELLALGFDSLGLHRIWAARSPDNAASRVVLDRVGMVEEGRIRAHVHVRGAWRDSVVHSVLATDPR
ncbi:GNAT family N-acetyltransferase [Streptomyces litchfieldiae]|uniref:GNAT family protein n=1 Tax=Streptomyces litchfieldiae TaxID=3075543 RepID=A0ABU2MUP7_9ACTN|nr:GNAT family protein [Streptomyces sp. DSM 44938]MDT0345196.1 GNAT family protein [Streptomyces sp. DSM 44938]